LSEGVNPLDVVTDPPASDTKPCKMCGKDILRVALRCEHCQSLQFTTQCVVCQEYIPFNADYCNECKSYQDERRVWGRYFGVSQAMLALIVALITVLTPLLRATIDFLNRDSNTKIVFQSATLDEIMIVAMNTGLRPSSLRRSWLEPAGHDVIRKADLKIVSDDLKMMSIIPANEQVSIRFRVRTGLTATVPHSELAEKLLGRDMLIVVEVEESIGDVKERSVTVGAEQLEDFILTQVPEFSGKVPR
jgi:hypothetical protein